MKYMGSKRRIAKEILPIILKDRQPGQLYVEPFVGGANSFELVDNPRLGADYFPPVIQALKLIRDNLDSIPRNNKEFTEEDYKQIKNDYNNPLHGFACFCYAFGGDYKCGWARDNIGGDYVRYAHNNAVKQSPKLQGSKLIVSHFADLHIQRPAIIYCDPPYKGTTKYKTKEFDYDLFYEWCHMIKEQGHKVFISEYNMPPDRFECIWQKEQICNIDNKNKQKAIKIEKLFVPK